MAGEPLPEDDTPPKGSTYGTAIALTDNGSPKPNGRGGWARVHDVDAVIQDLKIAVLTPQGDDPLRPRYGRVLSRLLGSSVPSFKTELRRILLFDGRVAAVPTIDIDGNPAVNRSNLDVTVTVELREGEVATFSFTPRTFA
ncbi:hypothetical protein [Halomarina oriensis]|uniref:Baseplate assembly protein n=1 Tax=Halomarina oriensis TaxID=671145 RepID=A0A6B0GR76_9EURY|nr:hypothetical protein [Halomarina oriensis]MWG36581.1 hypothetical protein [Halomarina oriensis]